jgi:hypothetical protein
MEAQPKSSAMLNEKAKKNRFPPRPLDRLTLISPSLAFRPVKLAPPSKTCQEWAISTEIARIQPLI